MPMNWGAVIFKVIYDSDFWWEVNKYLMSLGNYNLLPTSSPQHASRRKNQPNDNKIAGLKNLRIQGPGYWSLNTLPHIIGIPSALMVLFVTSKVYYSKVNHHDIGTWSWITIPCGWSLSELHFRNPCQYQIFSYLADPGASILDLSPSSKGPSRFP